MIELLNLSACCVIGLSMIAFLFTFSRTETGQRISMIALAFALLWFIPLVFMFLCGGIR